MPHDVGIVMPVYQQDDHFLTLAIQSVLRQTYRKFRLIVVLDGAPAHTGRLVRQLVRDDKRVRVVSSQRNRGIAHALNRGFRSLYHHSQIRYLTWVSSDNVYRPNFVDELRKAIRRGGTHTGLVYSAFRFINDRGKSIWDKASLKEHFEWMKQPKENLLDVCFMGTSFMYKRRHAEKAGPYQLEPVEDYDFWLRLTEHCEIQYVPKILMDYRVNSSHSVTRKLHFSGSQSQHRRWRVGFETAKYNARRRRGIRPDLAVVTPVGTGHGSIRAIESLYEQTFSNFEAILVDVAPGSAESRRFEHILDPRVTWVKAPRQSLHRAVRLGAEQAKAPLVMLYPAAKKLSPNHLQNLRANYRAGSAAASPKTLNALQGKTWFSHSVDWESGLYPTKTVRAH